MDAQKPITILVFFFWGGGGGGEGVFSVFLIEVSDTFVAGLQVSSLIGGCNFTELSLTCS